MTREQSSMVEGAAFSVAAPAPFLLLQPGQTRAQSTFVRPPILLPFDHSLPLDQTLPLDGHAYCARYYKRSRHTF